MSAVCIVVLIVLGLVWLLTHLKNSRATRRVSSGGGTHDVYTMSNMLSADVFDKVKTEAQEYLRSRVSGAHRSDNFMRRGRATSHLDGAGHLGATFAALDDLHIIGGIREATGLSLQYVPKTDSNRVSLLVYDEPGDGIDWHRDGNAYYGERWVGLFTVLNNSEAALELKMHDGSIKRYGTKENEIILFRGDQVEHRSTPIGEDEERVVVSIVLCNVCEPTLNPFNKVYQMIVNLLFYGSF